MAQGQSLDCPNVSGVTRAHKAQVTWTGTKLQHIEQSLARVCNYYGYPVYLDLLSWNIYREVPL